MLKILGLCAAIVLPLWNIPLILKMRQRQSSKDVSLWWAFGVWSCLALMVPSGLNSPDIVFKAFTISNVVLFTAVVVYVVKYR